MQLLPLIDDVAAGALALVRPVGRQAGRTRTTLGRTGAALRVRVRAESERGRAEA